MNKLIFSTEPIGSLSELGILWRRLEQGGQGSFFISWTWIGTWLKSLPDYLHPILLRAKKGEKTVAAAILVRRRERRRGILNVRQVHFNATGDPAFDCLAIELNGFVGASDRPLWQEFLLWFARGEAQADELFLPGVCNDWLNGLAQDARLLHRKREQTAYICDTSAEPLRNRLSRNARQQLRRSLRACEELGEVRIEGAASPEIALAFFAELKAMHISLWQRRGQPHAFRYPFFEAFHRRLIEAGVENGSVRLLRISAGTVVIGYLYDFRNGTHISAYQSGYDGELSDFRPGYVSHALAIEQSIDVSATIYDFLGGSNQLKRSFANQTYTLGWHRFGRPTAGLQAEATAIKLANIFRPY